MTQPALGSGEATSFQVSVSTLTLGTLYEAILSFSAQESLERFWPAVCQNARWLIPSRRMCALLAADGPYEVTARFERGQLVPAAGDGYGGGDPELAAALGKGSTQWFSDPGARFAQTEEPLTRWLLAGSPASLFVLPVQAGRRTLGAMLFAMGAIAEGDRAMLNTLGTIFALHVGMSYTLIRITQEQRQMQQQLVMKEKMASLGKLVAGLVHEVNSPIGAINSTADVSRRAAERVEGEVARAETLDGLRQEERFRRALQVLRDNSQVTLEAGARIAGLMGALRSFVRLDEAEFQMADVEEGLDSAVALLQQQLGEGVRLVKDYGHLPRTFCSPGQLNQAFMNVLQNAVQAVRGQGEVRIRTWQERADLWVEIQDTGVGIAPEQLRHIFEVAFRSKDGRVRMGSGLSVTYHIVDEHGGQIAVESQVGKGTRVRVRLPWRAHSSA